MIKLAAEASLEKEKMNEQVAKKFATLSEPVVHYGKANNSYLYLTVYLNISIKQWLDVFDCKLFQQICVKNAQHTKIFPFTVIFENKVCMCDKLGAQQLWQKKWNCSKIPKNEIVQPYWIKVQLSRSKKTLIKICRIVRIWSLYHKELWKK